MCTLPSTNAPKEFTIWWFLLVFKTQGPQSTCINHYTGGLLLPSYAVQYTWLPLQLMEPALNTAFVHLATNLLGGIVSPAQVTREAIYMDSLSHQQGQHFTVANTTMVSSGEKCFPTCLDSFKGSFFFIRSLPRSASLSELPASLLWPFSLGSADTQFSDSLGFLPGCLSHFSFRSWGFSDMSFCKGD